jgi:hypothetical protein
MKTLSAEGHQPLAPHPSLPTPQVSWEQALHCPKEAPELPGAEVWDALAKPPPQLSPACSAAKPSTPVCLASKPILPAAARLVLGLNMAV